MAHPAQPTHGARFHIERQKVLSEGAQYNIQIHMAEEVLQYETTLPLEGALPPAEEWQLTSEEPQALAAPAWALRHASALMRQCQQQAKKKGWPRRIRRWRDAPSSEEEA